MSRESTASYIFRIIMSLGILSVLILLYWSSVLLEHDMNQVKQKLDLLSDDIKALKHSQYIPVQAIQTTTKERPHIDKSLPNLLEEDSFYTITLPKMLGPDFKPHGKIRQAMVGKHENLHPFSQWADVIDWTNMCNVSVAGQKFGYYETFSSDMALKMEWRQNEVLGVPEFWIHLRDGVYYEPLRKDYFSENLELSPHFFQKHQVTARDFKFYFDAIMNPHVEAENAVVMRTYLADIEEFKVIDDLTFVVRWKTETYTEPSGKIIQRPKYIAKLLTGGLKPLASFVYQYFADGEKIVPEDQDENFYRTNSIWGQNFTNHFAKNIIVSCGPWIFDGITDRQIQFKRNPNFYNPFAALTDSKIIAFKQSPENIWQDFQSGNVDTYGLQPDQLIEYDKFIQSQVYQEQLRQGNGVDRLDYFARRYVHIQWNQAKPYFQSKKVRQALTIAINRQRIIKQNLNGMGIEITGPFFRFSPAYDENIKPWPYDPQLSKLYLEEEGWYDSDGDGIIDKEINGNRVPFEFKLTYYVKNPLGKSICEYVATALKDVGILCRLNGVDVADISAVFEDKSFDALFFIWGLGSPPEDPEQLWQSNLANVKGSSNAIGFANPQADAIIQKLKIEYDPQERIRLYHEFDRIIHEEAPYTFLFMPKTALIYRTYLQNVFIPAQRQDILPGANVQEPDSSIFWIK